MSEPYATIRRGVLKPRMQELGRIRIGERILTGKKTPEGKEITRPKRLETFRLTSTNPVLLASAAKLYGGEVTEWEGAPGGRQWQLYTTSNCLSVTVPPEDSLQQAYEQYDNTGECILQCDTEHITHAKDRSLIGTPCQHDPAHVDFDVYTRLKVMLHNLPSALGVWVLRTSGYHASSELLSIAPFLENASRQGLYLECTLRIEMRKSRKDGQNLIFPVVALQPSGVTFQQLLTGNIPTEALIAPPHTAPQLMASSYVDDATNESVSAVDLLYGDAPVSIDNPVQSEKTRTPMREPIVYEVNKETGEIERHAKNEELTVGVEAEIESSTEEITEPSHEAEEDAAELKWSHDLLQIKAKLNESGIKTQAQIKQLIARCDGDTSVPFMKIRDRALIFRMMQQIEKDSSQPEIHDEEQSLL